MDGGMGDQSTMFHFPRTSRDPFAHSFVRSSHPPAPTDASLAVNRTTARRPPEQQRDIGMRQQTGRASRHLGMNVTNGNKANSNLDPNPLSSGHPSLVSRLPLQQHVMMNTTKGTNPPRNRLTLNPTTVHRPSQNSTYICKSRALRILGNFLLLFFFFFR